MPNGTALPLQYRIESSLIIRMPLCMCSARRAGKSKNSGIHILHPDSCRGRRSIIRLDPPASLLVRCTVPTTSDHASGSFTVYGTPYSTNGCCFTAIRIMSYNTDCFAAHSPIPDRRSALSSRKPLTMDSRYL